MFKRTSGLQYAPEYAPQKVNPNQLHSLIKASYKRNGEARDIGSKVGYKLDDSLSNAEHKVFTDSKGDPYVAYTGSRKIGDWLTNAAIGVGLGRYTSRFRNSTKLMDQVKQKYKNQPVTTVGHSLGGGISDYVGGDKVITLDKAGGIGAIGKNIRHQQTDIRTGSDPVSILNRTQHGGNRYTIRGTNYINPLYSHDYNHLDKFTKSI